MVGLLRGGGGIVLQQLLISFGLVYDSVAQSKRLFEKTKLGIVRDEVDEYSNAPKDQ